MPYTSTQRTFEINRWLSTAFDPPAAIDNPSVTVGTSSVITGGVDFNPKRIGSSSSDLDLLGDTHFRYKGFREATGVAANPAQYVQTKLKPGGTSQAAYWHFGCDFDTSSPQVEIRLRSATAAPNFNIRVNGRWLQQQDFVSTGVAAGVQFRVLLDFGTFTDRQRRIEIALTQATGFGGVTVQTGFGVIRPAEPIVRRIAVVGDSITNGAGISPVGANSMETFARRLTYLMGADETILAGIGGTGWIQTINSEAISVFGGRLPEVLAQNPHVVIFCGSRNDVFDPAALTAAVTSALDQCASVPEVYVAGVPYVLDPPSAVNFSQRNDIIRRATQAKGRQFVEISNTFYGASCVGTPSGNGNTDFYIQADKIHPNFEGHKHLANCFYLGLLGCPVVTPSAY